MTAVASPAALGAAPGAAPCRQPAAPQNVSGAVWASRGGVPFPQFVFCQRQIQVAF